MLKGREIALTLRSSWIMNVVSINVCIINHISTNWTSVEPVVLSDMETAQDYCLCFIMKDSSMICRFRRECDAQVERATATAPLLFLHITGTDCLGLNGQIFAQFRTGKQEKWGGNASRKCCCVLRICFIVFQKICYLAPSNNNEHQTVVRDTGDLMTVFSSQSLFFSSTHSDCRNLQTAEEQGNLLKSFSPQNHSLSWHDWLPHGRLVWGELMGDEVKWCRECDRLFVTHVPLCHNWLYKIWVLREASWY